MRNFLIPLSLVAVIASSPVLATELGDLLRSAAATDSAEGEVTGKVAEFWKQVTRSQMPVYAKISTIKRFKREDCRRLNVAMAQDQVPVKSGEKILYRQDFQINLCSDGTPPQESIEEFAKAGGKDLLKPQATQKTPRSR